MTDPKPMDPERLTDIREAVEWRRDRPMPMDDHRDAIIAELLADRDYQERRAATAATAERERDEARANVATAHADARDGDDADVLLRGWLAGAGDREKTQQWLDGENPWWHDANEDARAVERLTAEVTSLRARVRVEAEDVERSGVTLSHVKAWMRANGWGTPTSDRYGWTSAESETGGEPVDLWRTNGSTPIADTVFYIADDVQRPSLYILDEMAAMATRPTNCPHCNATLEWSRSGWEATPHNAYTCDGRDECEDVVCCKCMLAGKGACPECVAAMNLESDR